MNTLLRIIVAVLPLSATTLYADTEAITGRSLQLRSAPSFHAAPVGAVSRGVRVTVTQQLAVQHLVDGTTGRWVFVRTFFCATSYDHSCTEKLAGWSFDSTLVYRDSFAAANYAPFSRFSNCFGDACFDVRFAANGSYTYSSVACHANPCPSGGGIPCQHIREKRQPEGNRIVCTGWGRVYASKGLFILRNFDDTDFLVLYSHPTGRPCSWGFFECEGY